MLHSPLTSSAHSMRAMRTFPRFSNCLRVPRRCRERVGQGASFQARSLLGSSFCSLGHIPSRAEFLSLIQWVSRFQTKQPVSQSARLINQLEERFSHFPKQGGGHSLDSTLPTFSKAPSARELLLPTSQPTVERIHRCRQ